MKKIVYLLVIITSFSSCISLVNYQTGKTLGKGNSEIALSLEVFPLEDEDLSSVAFAPGVSYYRGISDKIDVGVRYEGGLAGSVGAKFQLLGNRESKFALAIDPRIGDKTKFVLGLPLIITV